MLTGLQIDEFNLRSNSGILNSLASFGVVLRRDVTGLQPATGHTYGCVVRGIEPGSKAEEHGSVCVGDEVVEINSIPMRNKTDFEIEQILDSIRDEAELTCMRWKALV